MKQFRKYHLLQILKGVDLKVPLDLFLHRYFKQHKAIGSTDRKKIADGIYGMVRWQGLLDHLLEESAPEKRFDLYFELNPKKIFKDSDIPPHIRVSAPKNLYTQLTKQYGDGKAMELCGILNTRAPTTVRINPAKTTREDLLAKLGPVFTKTRHSPLGLQTQEHIPLFSTEEFQKGFFEIQDEGSQLLAALLQPKPSELVLDYCAGSGGKTLAFAHQMEGRGQIFLHDIRKKALLEGRKRMSRAGIQNYQFFDENKKWKKRMDWVLVDAPCSGTGTLRRNPDMKWRFTDEFLKKLISDQRTIFEKALSYLKPNGKIVYATCSLLHEENQSQVDHFIKTYNLELASPPLVLLPQEGGMDGFFGAILTRSA